MPSVVGNIKRPLAWLWYGIQEKCWSRRWYCYISAGAVSLLVIYAGFEDGNWRGVLITEVQVLAVAATAWFGLRA